MAETYSLQTAFSKIKEILGFDIQPAPAPIPAPVPAPLPVQLQDVALKDGSTLSVDKLEVGGVATIAGQPAPMADYEAADGSIIKIGDGGIISEIIATPVVPPAEVPATQMQDQPPVPQYVTPQVVQQMEAQFNKQKDELKQSFESVKAEFETLKTAFENQKTLIGKQKEALSEMFTALQQMANLPTDDPIETPKQSFASQQVESRKDKMKTLADNMKKFADKNK